MVPGLIGKGAETVMDTDGGLGTEAVTVTATGADMEMLRSMAPLYCAVSTLVPEGRVARVKVAEPLVMFAVPTELPLLRKVTEPVGTGPVPLDADAVSVTEVPRVVLSGEAVRVVVVATGEMVMEMVGEEDAARLVVAA